MNPFTDKEFTDEDLILRRYGELEPDRARALETALAADPQLAARSRALGRALAAADAVSPPKTPPDIAQRTWAAIERRLEPRRPARRRNWQLPAGLAAALALVAVSFQLGRQSVEHPTVPSTVATTVTDAQPFSAAARERVLIAQVAHHLEGSQRLFTTVANAPADAATLEAERRWARELLATHRTYRKAAALQGQKRIANLLDAMEPLLLELANAPDDVSPAELKALQQRIDDGDLVFRARSANRALAPNRNPLLGIQQANDTAM
jgi:hypothetical protein